MQATTINSSDIRRCPVRSLDPGHYRADRTCRCATKAAGVCEWFAACTNAATGTLPHPILGDVPVCDRCRAKYDEAAQ